MTNRWWWEIKQKRRIVEAKRGLNLYRQHLLLQIFTFCWMVGCSIPEPYLVLCIDFFLNQYSLPLPLSHWFTEITGNVANPICCYARICLGRAGTRGPGPSCFTLAFTLPGDFVAHTSTMFFTCWYKQGRKWQIICQIPDGWTEWR